MKKNFFKKLSFVMALAMIVSIIAPAAGAFAAEDLHLNATKVYRHLSATTGYNEYDFNIHGTRQAGWKYDWTSSNEDVATVDSVGLTTATGVGSAKISVAITDKEGADVATLDATVVVRDNIKAITEVYMQTKDAPALDKLQAATDYDFGRKFETVSGSTTETSSVTRWFVDSAKATITDAGVFKATEAGTYKITAVAFQSKDKYNAWLALKDTTSTVNVLASKTLEVKVVNEATVAQTNLSTVKVSFKAPVASLAAADVAVNYIVTATKTPVPQVVKKVTLADDKMSATVEMYNAFAGGATYSVVVAGMAAKEFTAATTNVADVDYFTITPATAAVKAETDVVVKLFNKNNVEITTPALLLNVSLKSSSEKAWFVEGTKKLTMYNIGDTTTISGIFHTYNYDNAGVEAGAKTASVVVTCVPAATVSIGSVTAYTVAAAGAPDFSKENHAISLSDNGTLHLYVKANMIGDDKATPNSKDNAANFRISSNDNSILIINGDTLYPVKEGTVAVIVDYSTDGFVTKTTIGSVAVTVSAEKKATTLDLGSYAFALSNDADVADTKAVTIKVKDQYGNDMTVANVTVEKLANAALPDDLVVGGAGSVNPAATSVTFAGAGADKGTYTYKITANTLVKYVNVTVQEPSSQVVSESYYKLNVGSTFDRKIDADHLSTTATIQVFAYASNGVANNIVAVTGGAVSVKLFDPTGADKTSLLTYGASSAALTVAQSASPAAVQIATGTWTLKLYNANSVVIDTVTFTVTDSSPSLVATTVKLVSDLGAGTINAAVQDCFTAKYNDVDVTAKLAAGDTVGAGSVIFVKTITYKDDFGVTHSATVNTAITVQ